MKFRIFLFNFLVASLLFIGSTGTHAQGTLGDANGDGKVDGIDFSIWLNNYNTTTTNGASDGDFNEDGRVDGIDFSIWLNNYGTVASPTTSEPTNTPFPTATAVPSPTLPPIGSSEGIWLSSEEIMNLPTSGSAWNNVYSEASSSWGSVCLDDNNCTHDVKTLAGALVCARKGEFCSKTITGLRDAMSTSSFDVSLQLQRGLQSYVIAADLIGYREVDFQNWVRDMIDANIPFHSDSKPPCGPESTSISCGGDIGAVRCDAMLSSNNWGGHARASMAAAALYLNDPVMIDQIVTAHKAFIGIPVSNHMTCDSNDWNPTSGRRYPLVPRGITTSLDGNTINISGVLPEDWERCGSESWPPCSTGYMWEGMQGFVVSAAILHRAGLVPFNAGDNAVVRAMNMLYGRGEASSNPSWSNPASGDDTWIPWLVNYYAGTSFPTDPSNEGKGMGYTDWTHAR